MLTLPCTAPPLQELLAALQQMGPPLLAQVDDAVACFGLDPEAGRLTDEEFVGAMAERRARFQAALEQRCGPEALAHGTRLREALCSHMHLAKLAAAEVCEGGVGGTVLPYAPGQAGSSGGV